MEMTRSKVKQQLIAMSRDRPRIIEIEKLMDTDDLMEDERRLCSLQIMTFHEKYDSLMTAIGHLENGLQKAIIYRHYVLGETIEQVSKEVHYSTRQVCRISQEGVDNICKILKMS